MKIKVFAFSIFLCLSLKVFSGTTPDEGMWLPLLVERLNYTDMKKMGLRLTAEELYSINNSCVKDAIVSLGGFCTAELISSQGLLLTNHHCGNDAIQKHSSLETDYLKNGFWAKTFSEELPNEGLKVSFLVRMEDVTLKVLEGVSNEMGTEQRGRKISKAIAAIEKAASEKGKYVVEVKDFFSGNEYYLFVYREYTDVRLVGAPPTSIGNYGGDTDNWMWPRHTGDFSLFRVYTAPDGSPAPYSSENIPMKAAYHLPISLKGVQKNDFAMIWGYPGSTERFLTSTGVDYNISYQNPLYISLLGAKVEVMREAMGKSDDLRIKYASKAATASNGWKYFLGQNRQLHRNKVFDQKIIAEQQLKTWIAADPQRQKKYGSVLDSIKENYTAMKKLVSPFYHSNMAGLGGADIISLALEFLSYNSNYYDALRQNKSFGSLSAEINEKAYKHFKDYDTETDRLIFASLLKLYKKNVEAEYLPEIFKTIDKKFKGDIDAYSRYVYSNSVFANPEAFTAFMKKPSLKKIDKDPATIAMNGFIASYLAVSDDFEQMENRLNNSYRILIKAYQEMQPTRIFYPDANSSMRMTYGTVCDYYPADAVFYNYFTTLEGVMEKEDADNDEFIVPIRLKELFNSKDYGRYADKNGKINVCFITNNDITGGNSGSPVLNGKGELIGCAFDGNWEAMSGDIHYENRVQRTISVDIRYVLFIIDKFANAQNLINEMTIVE